jgi:hypothetical protein
LADLFLWISVVDECQYHPSKAFDRAAKSENLKSAGIIQQGIKKLEGMFGKLFSDWNVLHPRRQRRNRNGVPNEYGIFLAEVFSIIEHLYFFSITAGQKDRPFSRRKYEKMIELVKDTVFIELPTEIRRAFDSEIYFSAQTDQNSVHKKYTSGKSRMSRGAFWRGQLVKMQATGHPSKLSELPPRLSRRSSMRTNSPRESA